MAPLRSVLAGRELQDPRSALLFTWTGRMRMKVIAGNGKAYAHWRNRYRRVTMYGSADAVSELEASLKELIAELDQMKTTQWRVRRRKRKSVFALLSSLRSKHKTDELLLRGRDVVATAHPSTLVLIENALNAEHLIVTSTDTPVDVQDSEEDDNECLLCGDEYDRPYTLQGCGHRFCEACLPGLFHETRLPISCPECQSQLSWGDIDSLASVADKTAAIDAAVKQYVNKHLSHVRNCPVPGCDALLWMGDNPEPQSSAEEAQRGGHVADCHSCSASLCVTCSSKFNKLVDAHPGSSCAVAQDAQEGALQAHVQHIRENLLTHKCPRCQKAFIDFDGCFALKCDCGAGFCAWCLEDCGIDAHSHVATCKAKPPNAETYHAPFPEFEKIHQERRRKAIEQYLHTIHDTDLARGVLKVIQPNLRWNGITDLQVPSE
eukprot:INCI8137.1.p1 GENE.INCI8137.1~~INCI8137.1.p1  ORF type:complete len:485 (-),score=72.90 INCI8137.1:34-1335(-)